MNHKSNAFNYTNCKQQHFFITFASLMEERTIWALPKTSM